MSENIRQLSEKLGITKHGVEMRMSRVNGFRDKYTKRVNGKIIVSDKGVKVLSHGHSRKPLIGNYYYHVSYKRLLKINSLKALLKTEKQRDAQMKEALGQLKHDNDNVVGNEKRLEKLLDQQQQLQLASEKQNKRLRAKLNSPAEHHHRGFWHRLFGLS